MCRSKGEGFRRCPACINPVSKALRYAKTSARRWESRLSEEENSASDSRLNHILNKLGDTMVRLRHREQVATGTDVAPRHPDTNEPAPPPAPTAADKFTDDYVDSRTWEELGDEHAALHYDPEAQRTLEEAMDRRDAREHATTIETDLNLPEKPEPEAVWGEWEPGDHSFTDTQCDPTIRHSKLDVAARQFDEYVGMQYTRAEIATNGQFLNAQGRAAGIDSYELFRGPVSRVKKYGSDELQSFFGQNGRHTLASFRYTMYHWHSDRKAYENARTEDFANVAHIDQPTY